MPKLESLTFVKNAGPKSDGTDAFYWDDALKGWGLRVKASGVKSWILQYRNQHGTSRRFTIGKYGDALPPAQARKTALKLLGRIQDGGDPAAEKRGLRDAVTVGALCEDYLEAAEGRLKPNTLTTNTAQIALHIRPLLGAKVVAELRKRDIERFIRDVETGKTAAKVGKDKKRPRGGLTKGGPGAAARTTVVLGAILERAVADGLIETNPVRGVRRPRIEPRQPPFSFKLVEAVGKAMAAIERQEREELRAVRVETTIAHGAIRQLILCGSRRMETLGLKWGELDFEFRCIRYRDTKTGRQVRPLGKAAIDHLSSFKPANAGKDTYVFPGKAKSGAKSPATHFIGLPKAWARICSRAKVEGVSIHGIRHWFASAAAELGYSDLVIGALLGHAKQGVTGRYANAPDAALCLAADRISDRLRDALSVKNEAMVLPFPHAGR